MSTHRHTAGRFLVSKAIAKGDDLAAAAYSAARADWLDRNQVVGALKAAVDAVGTDAFPGSAFRPVAESFLESLRDFSVPDRLAELRHVPLNTRLFVNAGGIVGTEVAEGAAAPVLQGSWETLVLEPRKFSAIIVKTDELVRASSPTAAAAIADELAAAVAEAENFALLNPDTAASVFHGQQSISGTGSTLAQVDADLRALVDAVEGADLPGATFVMSKPTATFVSLLRGSGGGPAFPSMALQNGRLLGLPVIVNAALETGGSPVTRAIGLLSPREIYWGDDGRIELTTSRQAALKMDDAADATAGALFSLWQASATAFMGSRYSAWYAKPGAAAYLTVSY